MNTRTIMQDFASILYGNRYRNRQKFNFNGKKIIISNSVDNKYDLTVYHV